MFELKATANEEPGTSPAIVNVGLAENLRIIDQLVVERTALAVSVPRSVGESAPTALEAHSAIGSPVGHSLPLHS